MIRAINGTIRPTVIPIKVALTPRSLKKDKRRKKEKRKEGF